MSKVITFSRQFPSYHPKAGQPTGFVEKILHGAGVDYLHLNALGVMRLLNPNKEALCVPVWSSFTETKDTKYHTIRAGRRWKAGDWFTPRVWGTDINPKSARSGPYHSKQIQFAQDIQVKKVWRIELVKDSEDGSFFLLNGEYCAADIVGIIAHHDGLSFTDLMHWFKYPKPTGEMQIICWNESIEY